MIIHVVAIIMELLKLINTFFESALFKKLINRKRSLNYIQFQRADHFLITLSKTCKQ
ncbi:MAG: hypothetical protein CM1200mP30_02430 [Pseudomonadota bacterium]|nr:MAG: hypothetical protein CM1200mP30_02430 [Pseudomonadota bacterium]